MHHIKNQYGLNLMTAGEGLPLVFFHGWGFDHRIWLSLVPLLGEYYQLILVDLPGFGASPLMDWSQFKEALLTQLPAQSVVVGWSLGGLYATRLVVEEESRFLSLVNITSSPRFTAQEAWPGVDPALLQQFYQRLAANSEETLNEFIRLQLQKSDYSWPVDQVPQGLAAGLDILAHWDLRDTLHQITIPSCFMFGRLDPLASVKTMQAMQELYPALKCVLFPKAAHIPFLSHPTEFIHELRNFFNEALFYYRNGY